MTSLAYSFTKEKALVKIIFGRKILICQPIFKLFVAFFTTFGMQEVSKITFFWRISGQGDMQKGSFQMMV